MLVLSRQKDEEVVVLVKLLDGTTKVISVIVAEIRGDKVRLGFDADPDVVIHRREVLNAIELAKKQPHPKTPVDLPVNTP